MIRRQNRRIPGLWRVFSVLYTNGWPQCAQHAHFSGYLACKHCTIFTGIGWFNCSTIVFNSGSLFHTIMALYKTKDINSSSSSRAITTKFGDSEGTSLSLTNCRHCRRWSLIKRRYYSMQSYSSLNTCIEACLENKLNHIGTVYWTHIELILGCLSRTGVFRSGHRWAQTRRNKYNDYMYY